MSGGQESNPMSGPEGSSAPPPGGENPTDQAQEQQSSTGPDTDNTANTDADAQEGQNSHEAERTSRKNETDSLSSAILYRKINGVRRELQGKSSQEKTRILAGSEGKAKLYSLAVMGESAEITEMPLSQERPVLVTIEGNKVPIVSITGAEGEKLRCRVQIDADTKKNVMLSRQDVVNAQLIAEKAAILSALSGNERKIVEAYIDQLEGNNQKAAALTDQEVQEAAAENGFLTAEDVKTMIKARRETAVTPEQKAQEKVFEDQILRIVKDKNILDGETIIGILGKAGYSKENIGTQQRALEQERTALRERLEENPNDNDAQKRLEAVNTNIEIWKKAALAISEDGGVKDYIDKLQKGEIDMDTSKELVKAFRENNFDAIIMKATPELAPQEGDTDAQLEEKRIKREHIKSIAKNSGLAGLGLMLLLMIVASSVVKTNQ